MNESMNFGSIGFGNVSSVNNNNNSSNTQQTAKQETTTTNTEAPQNGKIDLMAGVKEAQEEQERKKLEEQQAMEDFKKGPAKKTNFERDADNFSQIDFGPLKRYLDDDDITDISYSNNGQLWLKSLEKGVYRAEQQDVDNELIEKIAFQCSNVMGKTFNMAHPFLDSESAELRMNFVHESIARNGIACVFRKTPAKIRLEKNKLLNEKYIELSIHEFLINCVKGHCNIIVCGETGSGKTELVKYLASHTAENEKLITIEDTLELHLDRIFPQRDIVAMKTNNIASYSDVLVTCMRQNPKWILLSEVRSAEAVTAVRNSISSGHYILSTIHADKAESIPHRMYSLLESNIDVVQFLKTIYRYVQIGVFVRGRYSSVEKRFVREIAGVCEFFVTDDNEPQFNNIYLKNVAGEEFYTEPTKYIKGYLEGQGIDINNLFGEKMASLAEANKANGIESDVKEPNGQTVHIPGKTTNNEQPILEQNKEQETINNNIGPKTEELIQNNNENKGNVVNETTAQETIGVIQTPVQQPITQNSANMVTGNSIVQQPNVVPQNIQGQQIVQPQLVPQNIQKEPVQQVVTQNVANQTLPQQQPVVQQQAIPQQAINQPVQQIVPQPIQPVISQPVQQFVQPQQIPQIVQGQGQTVQPQPVGMNVQQLEPSGQIVNSQTTGQIGNQHSKFFGGVTDNNQTEGTNPLASPLSPLII